MSQRWRGASKGLWSRPGKCFLLVSLFFSDKQWVKTGEEKKAGGIASKARLFYPFHLLSHRKDDCVFFPLFFPPLHCCLNWLFNYFLFCFLSSFSPTRFSLWFPFFSPAKFLPFFLSFSWQLFPFLFHDNCILYVHLFFSLFFYFFYILFVLNSYLPDTENYRQTLLLLFCRHFPFSHLVFFLFLWFLGVLLTFLFQPLFLLVE